MEQHSTSTPVVNAFNEWDPLEEIVVGRVDETTLVPPWDVIMPAVVHDKTQWDFFKQHGGTPWPVEMLKKAERDLDAFIDVLRQAGVTVRQPEPYAYERPAGDAGLGGREQLLRADASRRALRHRRPDHRGADGLAQPVDRAARVPRALQGVLPRRRPLGRRPAAAPLGRELRAGVRGPGGGRTPALPAHRVRADVRRGRRHQVRPRRLHRPLQLLQPLRHRVAAASPRRRVRGARDRGPRHAPDAHRRHLPAAGSGQAAHQPGARRQGPRDVREGRLGHPGLPGARDARARTRCTTAAAGS